MKHISETVTTDGRVFRHYESCNESLMDFANEMADRCGVVCYFHPDKDGHLIVHGPVYNVNKIEKELDELIKFTWKSFWKHFDEPSKEHIPHDKR